MNTNIRDFVEYLVLALCNTPEEVEVELVSDEQGDLVTIRVAESDMGRVIGRAGKNITALRTLVNVMGARTDQKTSIKVLE